MVRLPRATASQASVRVLQIHNRYRWRGGEDVVVDAERDLLREHGHAVERFEVGNDELQGAADMLRTGWSAPGSPAMRRLVAAAIRDASPDVVHCHNLFPRITVSAYDACADHGVPVVQTLHNYRSVCARATLYRGSNECEECIDGSPYRAVLHRCYRDSRIGSLLVARMIDRHRRQRVWERRVNRLIVLSEHQRDKLAAAGIAADRMTVKPNFVPDPGHRPRVPRTGAARGLFVGRLSDEKGLDLLLSAWSRDLGELVVVGDGPLRPALTPPPTGVRYLGPMSPEGVRAQMREADFLVVPARAQETFGLTAVEGLACGLPVVASARGALPEIVEDGVCGLLVPAGDVEAWRLALRRLATDRELCGSLGEGARRRYEQRYTPEQNYRLMAEIYTRVTGGRDGEA